VRTSGRRPEKEVVVEPDNDDKYIDVKDKLSNDDFVDMGRNTSYALGLRRSGRNIVKEVYDPDHAKTVASGSKAGKAEKQGRKGSRETSMSEEEKKLKPNQKACLEEIGFGGMVEFKVDGTPSKLRLYFVDNFDENKMETKLSKGSIILTKDMIGVML
nr:major facilitator superfamily domain, general substrate transporter [Tanacetum cinerariifolium]